MTLTVEIDAFQLDNQLCAFEMSTQNAKWSSYANLIDEISQSFRHLI